MVGALGVCEEDTIWLLKSPPTIAYFNNMKVSFAQSKIGIGVIREAKSKTCITCIKHGGFGLFDADTWGPGQSDRSESEHNRQSNSGSGASSFCVCG
jgi:hypothetical protein